MNLNKMKINTRGFILSLVLLPLSQLLGVEVLAAEKVDVEYELTSSTDIRVFNLRGSIEIKGWDKNLVKVKGVLDEESTGLVFEEKGNQFIINVEMPRQISPKKGSKLFIFVPQTSAIVAKGVSSSWSLEAVGDININSVSGDVAINHSSGDVKLDVVSAPVSVKSVAGDLRVTSLSGKINVTEISGEVSLSTVEGELHFSQPIIELARLSSINGAIYIDGEISKQGSLSVTSVDGDVFLKVGTSDALNCQLQALHGGDIKNYLKVAGKESKRLTGKQLSLIIGEGGAIVEATTISGTIHLQD